MSGLQFKDVVIENFLSIAKGNLNLADRGLLLIKGDNSDDPSADSNGAGKSSVPDAICWVIFGTTARGVAGDDVINRFVGKGCRVSLTVIDDSTTYKIVRHRKHKTGKNRLTVKQGRKDLTKGTDKLTQEVVNGIIGCSPEVFQAAIYAGQEQMPDLPGMTDKHLKLIVEEAAGVTILENAYEIARHKAGMAKTNHERVAIAIDGHQDSMEESKHSIADIRRRSADWSSEQTAKSDDVRDRAKTTLELAKERKKRLAKFDPDSLKARKAEIEKSIAEIEGSKPSDSEVRRLQGELSAVEAEIKSLNAMNAQGKKRIEDSENLVGQPCDRCRKPYTSADIVGVVKTSKDEVKSNERGIHERLLKRRELSLALDAAIKKFDDARSVTSPAHLYKQMAKISEGLHKLESDQSALQSLVREAQALRERLREIESESNPYESMIEPLQKKLSELAGAIEGFEEEEKADREKMEALDGATKVFSPTGVRGAILDSVTPFLNEQSSHYLGVLSDGNITAEWKTVGETKGGEAREKFHIAVTNSEGADSFAGLSGGERRKVRIATAMALQDLVASRAFKPINLFIADEVDDALDAAGLERLMSILEDKARSVGTTLIISHNDIGDWVRNQVTVRKRGGSSIIEEAA